MHALRIPSAFLLAAMGLVSACRQPLSRVPSASTARKAVPKGCQPELLVGSSKAPPPVHVEWPHSFPTRSSFKPPPEDAMLCLPAKASTPCHCQESDICGRACVLDKDSDLRMVHWYNIDRLFAENPYVKRDKPARSTFRAYYATDDEVERAIAADDRLKARDDPTFRTGRPAIAGEYLGAAPVGVWQLWSPEGVLLGYQDFASADSSFIPCQSNP